MVHQSIGLNVVARETMKVIARNPKFRVDDSYLGHCFNVERDERFVC
jgi:hypothetical protein